MKTQGEINNAATEYAEEQNSAYTNDLYGFIAGATFANGYSEEEMCGFAEWVNSNCIKSGKWYRMRINDGIFYSMKQLLKKWYGDRI